MIIENFILYALLYIVLELYEVHWQKAETLMGMMARMYGVYKKSIFLFLVMHPTFYFAVWFLFSTNYNPYALMLFSLKSADIITKLLFMKKIFIDKDLDKEMQLSLFIPLGEYLPYIGIVVYPFFIYMALS